MPPGDALPETLVPTDDTKDIVYEVDAVILIRPDTIPLTTTTGTAQLSSFTDTLSKGHVPKVLLAHDQHANVPLMPEQDPDLICSVITTLLSLSTGVSAASRFSCCALLVYPSRRSLAPPIHPTIFYSYLADGLSFVFQNNEAASV